MPSQTPILGETWEMTDNFGRSTRGIVAEISVNVITLVALTGARIRVSPDRLTNQWSLAASPPRTTLNCSRCRQPGILRFQRGMTPDFVCPKHLPVGVLASLTPGEPVAEEDRATAPKNIIVCPQCGNADPVEDVRLGRLEQGQFGWWTCTLCSSRWGLIAEPAAETDNRGRWYGQALADLHHTMLEHNVNMTRIQISRSAWIALSEAFGRGEIPLMTINFDLTSARAHEALLESGLAVGTMFEVPIQMVASLSDGSVLVRAPNAPAGSAIASSRRPIQRIGGIGNRGAVLFQQTEVTKEEQEALRQAPLEVSIAVEKSNIRKPRPGDRYVQRRTGSIVHVQRVEDSDGGGWSVALQDTSYTGNGIGQAPYILWMNDFLQGFVPFSQSVHSEPPPVVPSSITVVDNEDWYAYEFNEYVRVQSTDYRRMITVVRGASTGKLWHIPITDFADESKLKRFVRRTSYQRLMEEDEF